VRYNDSGSLIMRWPTAEKTTPTVMSPFWCQRPPPTLWTREIRIR